MSSSSSQSSGVMSLEINDILINKDIVDVIPFIYYGEDKFQGDGTNLKFKFRTVTTSYFDYSNIINPVSVNSTSNTIAIPENSDSKYTDTPIFYVDLITEDKSGIKNLSVTGQSDLYMKQNPTYTFVIPKFIWSNTINKTTITTGESLAVLGSVWIGSDDKKVRKIEYSSNMASTTTTITLDSEIDHILLNDEGSEMYITSYDNLYKYTVDHYLNKNNKYIIGSVKNSQLYNDNNKQMVFFDGELWSVCSYSGKIIKQDTSTLLETYEKSGFDSPIKIKKSTYHNFHIIAGTNILWKFDGTNKYPIYQINNYKISDFDISVNGEIAITLISNDNSIFRVLDRNFYKILYNQKIDDGKFRFCKYADSKFYAIAELESGTASYHLAHYVYDLTNKTSNFTTSTNDVLESGESSSEVPASNKVEVQYPNGGEVLLLNSVIDIKWKSTESVNDSIKIELYKNGELYETIASSTPNTGVFRWTISSTIDIASDYKMKITWLAPPPNDYSDLSNANFRIVDFITSSSEEIVQLDVGLIAGIDYDSFNKYIVVVLKDGFLGYYDLVNNIFNGLINVGVSDINCIAVRNEKINIFNTISKVRIFVGSQPYLSDKWDSGEVSTNLTSMFYGGGNNLITGENYYMNIQVYSDSTGWSEVQSKIFTMPDKSS